MGIDLSAAAGLNASSASHDRGISACFLYPHTPELQQLEVGCAAELGALRRLCHSLTESVKPAGSSTSHAFSCSHYS